jgi:hypothetical protein
LADVIKAHDDPPCAINRIDMWEISGSHARLVLGRSDDLT